MYEALVGEVLSAEDVLTEQKDIFRIAALAKLVVLSIKYTHEPNYRATDIAYGVVAIIKKIHNYGNDQSPVNAYYQALRELREVRTTESAGDTASVTGSSRGSFTLDRTWYNIRNLWKGKKKEEIEEPEEQFYISLSPSPTEDPFREVPLKAVFDKLDPKEGLYEFKKKGTTSRDLASYLSKHLKDLLKNREQLLKDKRTFRIGYTEKTSEIL